MNSTKIFISSLTHTTKISENICFEDAKSHQNDDNNENAWISSQIMLLKLCLDLQIVWTDRYGFLEQHIWC